MSNRPQAWLLMAFFGALACARSQEDIQREFAGFVAGANQCTMVSECLRADTGCPLGCGVAVRADRKADVEAKARELISQYERWGTRCDYECVQPGPLLCFAGRCTLGPAQSGASPDAGTD